MTNYIQAKDWVTKAGFRAVINLVIHDMPSHFCGYVAVPDDHPARITSEQDLTVEVHGGVTYAQLSRDYPAPTNKPTYWIGYDCAHSGDKTPSNKIGTFKDLLFNINECEKLAEQLARMMPAPTQPKESQVDEQQPSPTVNKKTTLNFRHNYRELSEQEKTLISNIKEYAQRLGNTLENVAPQSREISLAKTKLEECVMWAVKGITG